MITVGINENVLIDKVEITDAVKGTLAFTFAEAGAEPKEEDPMAALDGNDYADTGGSNLTLRMFCPLVPFDKSSDGTPISPADQQKSAVHSLGDKKNILMQFLLLFMTKDKITFDLYKGAGITKENFASKITQEAVLQKVFLNMATDFVGMITPHINDQANPFRLLLVRQSVTKHFADFRGKFVADNPFVELMAIPKEASKVKFTKYELQKGLDKDTILDKSTADIAADAGVELEAENVFGD